MKAILILLVGLWLLVVAGLVSYAFRRSFIRVWSEPVLSRPVLIVESDDWGGGPQTQATCISELVRTLTRYRDRTGRKPVMTLGMVLAVPDAAKIEQHKMQEYFRRTIADPCFSELIQEIRRGMDAGVLRVHLHGMEHYWPATLLCAARLDPRIRGWLTQNEIPLTEELPAHLQTRWVDASALPSKSLSEIDIFEAVRLEVVKFSDIFGFPPDVVVPPTFVWGDTVEAAWAAHGIQVIVTPGRRYVGRGADGNLVPDSVRYYTGETGAAGIAYVVRDSYFEPALGHRAERALDALITKTRAARPTLLETHRFNFIGRHANAQLAVSELERLLAMALATFPELVFMSTAELVAAIKSRDPALVETGFWARLHVCLVRLTEVPRLKKVAWLTGIIVPAWLLFLIAARLTDSAGRTRKIKCA